MNLLLSQANSLPEALQGALQRAAAALARPAGARRHLDRRRGAVAHASTGQPAAGTRAGRSCPASSARRSPTCAQRPLLTPTDGTSRRTSGITLEHPRGALAVWIELGAHRPFTAEDRTLLALLAGHLGQGAAPGPPDRPAAGDRPGPAARHPRPGPAARRLRRALRAGHPPAGGRRRLVRHRRTARRADRHRRRRLRRPRPGRRHRHGPAAQRLPGPAAAGRQPRADPDRAWTASPPCVPGAICTTVFCGILDPRHRPADLLQRRPSARASWPIPTAGVELLDEGRSVPAGGPARAPGGPSATCVMPGRADAAALHRRPGRAPPPSARPRASPRPGRPPAGPGRRRGRPGQPT